MIENGAVTLGGTPTKTTPLSFSDRIIKAVKAMAARYRLRRQQDQ